MGELHTGIAAARVGLAQDDVPRIDRGALWPRLHLIELHDQPWFPSDIRSQITEALQFGLDALDAYAAAATVLRPMLEKSAPDDDTGCCDVIDLCSGGGGPWLKLLPKLAEIPVVVCLTDKFPNLEAYRRLSESAPGRIRFNSSPVDVAAVPKGFKGIRTIFTSFHHFRPHEAEAILQDAVNARTSIAIFESTARTPASIARIFVWAALQLLLAPFVTPFRWSRLFWTYVVPVIPGVLLFDGVVSCLRSYNCTELMDLACGIAAEDYEWYAGTLKARWWSVPITYLSGQPKSGSPG